MTRSFWLPVALFLAFIPPPQAHASDMVITVDDLPGGVQPLGTIRDTLVAHHVPSTYGFVNGSGVGDNPALLQALKDWVGAGQRVGNHTFHHASLGDVGLDTYLGDIALNEPLLRRVSGDEPSWRVFRYPFLVEGTSVRSRNIIRDYLHKNGYSVAQVTVDFYDWAFDEAFNRCRAQGNSAAVEALQQRYLSDAVTFSDWANTAAVSLFGRNIPHILLIHARPMTAEMLDALLSLYEEHGVNFVSMEAALADSAYATDVRSSVTGTYLRQLTHAYPGRVRAVYPDHPTDWMNSLCH